MKMFMKKRKQKAGTVLLSLLIATTALTGCEMGMNPDGNPDGNSAVKDSSVIEGSYTFPGGTMLHITKEQTVTFNRLSLNGNVRDYRGICIIEGKFLVITLTHTKTEPATEFQRLSQSQVLHAVMGDNHDIDLLPLEYRNTSRVNHLANAITETVWVYENGTWVHMGDETLVVARLPLPGIAAKDYVGTYKITAEKYVEMFLHHTKEEDENFMERLRVGYVIYGIYDDKSNTLGMYTGVIPSSSFYGPR